VSSCDDVGIEGQGHGTGRQPALDGVRALAVTLVLLFHAGIEAVPAGYLGVSVFFTLSGYLITTLLLREHDGSGRIDLGQFWSRRLRRLLPASTLCLLLVVVAAAGGAFATVEDLRADVVAAALEVYNWFQLTGSTSYGDLFGGSVSPLEHYWSLAIEEQFYWVWPLALVGLVAFADRFRRPIAVVIVPLTAASSVVAIVIALAAGPDAAYWSTFARLPEILVGASVAAVLRVRTPSRSSWSSVAVVALAVIVVASCTWPSASGPAYTGWLPVFALASAALVVGLQVPGPLRSALSLRPLVWLGAISYGVYLYHWPVFVLLRERGWELSRPPGLIVALSITIGLAVLSYRIVEQPIRTSTWRPRLAIGGAALLTSASVFAALLVVPTSQAAIRADDDLFAASAAAAGGFAASIDTRPLATAAPTTVTPPPPPNRTANTTPTKSASTGTETPEAGRTETTVPTTVTSFPLRVDLGPPPSRPVRMLVVGDSTSVYLAEGLAAWSLAHPGYATVDLRWCQGCTFLLEPSVVDQGSDVYVQMSREVISNLLPQAMAAIQPDLVVLMATVNDAGRRVWNEAEGELDPTDPRFALRAVEAYTDLTRSLLDAGAPDVVWVIPPEPLPVWKEAHMNEPLRYAAHRESIRAAVEPFGDEVSVADVHRWMVESDLADDRTWRPDGVHLDSGRATEMAESFLGPLLVERALSSVATADP
jgi:peptidoglycan/LPS O-acetylase OafA/YrhL